MRSAISNVSLFFVLRWLGKSNSLMVKNHDYDFVVVIPVLHEQKIIEKTVRHFLRFFYPINKITILLVTTEKEFIGLNYDKENTVNVINNFKEDINKLYEREVIKVIHFPRTDGKMVDQLNFAFLHILKNFDKDRKKLFISIYNADSRPSLDIFGVIASKAFLDKNKKVFQQSSIYYDNFHEIGENKNCLETMYLWTNGTLHSRWTLVHEIPRLFRQSYFLNKFKKRIFLSHCVGHGLFLRGDLLEKIKEMPTGTVTEDLFFGYVLSLLGESINPVPVMEMAEMPNSFSGAMKQKYVWFFGPLDHFNYEYYFSKKYPNKAGKLLMKWFTFQGIFPAFIWLVQGWFLLYLFMYPIISERYYLLWISLGIFLFYGPLSYWAILKKYSNLARLSSKDDKISCADMIGIIFFCFPAVFMHSIPPIFSVYSKIRFWITGEEPQKPKTER